MKTTLSFGTLNNMARLGNLYRALFGQEGYLTPLRTGISEKVVPIAKREGKLFGVLEKTRGSGVVRYSPLAAAAHALRIEILERPFEHVCEKKGEETCEAFLWKADLPLSRFTQEVLLPRLKNPKFGGLPLLVSQLVASLIGCSTEDNESIFARFHQLAPEARTFVMGEVLHQTRSTGTSQERWFTVLSLEQYLHSEWENRLAQLGYKDDWHSLNVAHSS